MHFLSLSIPHSVIKNVSQLPQIKIDQFSHRYRTKTYHLSQLYSYYVNRNNTHIITMVFAKTHALSVLLLLQGEKPRGIHAPCWQSLTQEKPVARILIISYDPLRNTGSLLSLNTAECVGGMLPLLWRRLLGNRFVRVVTRGENK